MGICVRLEHEDGKAASSDVQDLEDLLHVVLPRHDDGASPFLRYVDWYGRTVFNRAQMAGVAVEVQRALDRHASIGAQRLLGAIRDLAMKGQEEPHLYLVFEGD